MRAHEPVGWDGWRPLDCAACAAPWPCPPERRRRDRARAAAYLARHELGAGARRRQRRELALLVVSFAAAVLLFGAEYRLAGAANADPGGLWDWARFGLACAIACAVLAARPWRLVR